VRSQISIMDHHLLLLQPWTHNWIHAFGDGVAMILASLPRRAISNFFCLLSASLALVLSHIFWLYRVRSVRVGVRVFLSLLCIFLYRRGFANQVARCAHTLACWMWFCELCWLTWNLMPINSNIFCFFFLHLPTRTNPFVYVLFFFLLYSMAGPTRFTWCTHGTGACSFENISLFRTFLQVLWTACRTISRHKHETHSKY
jgi:hypothetical protein